MHFCCNLAASCSPILFSRGSSAVAVYAVPFHEPAEVRLCLQQEEIHSYEAAMAAQIAALSPAPEGAAKLLVAHAFVTGGVVSESERPLSVGGAATVPAAVFDGFDYVALGHLHAPQQVGREGIRYSGSLCKYSFSEENHQKSLTLLELAPGSLQIETRPLKPRKDLRTLRGTFEEIVALGRSAAPGKDDFLRIELLDRQPVLQARARLEPYFGHILEIRPVGVVGSQAAELLPRLEQLQPLDHFRHFYENATGEELNDAEERLLTEVIDEVLREEAER